MGEKIKVAGMQIDSKILDNKHNLERCIGHIRTTAGEGARLIVFPECMMTGYIFSSLDEAMPFAEPVPGPSTNEIISACRELNVYVVIGMLEKDGIRCYNTAALLGPGGLIGKHRKAHLPWVGIDRFVSHGDIPPTVYETAIGRIGMGICYDGAFPEHSRVLALKGADIVVLPTAWPEGADVVPKFYVPTRAMENHVYFIAVNRVGEERGVRFIGCSKIAWWGGRFLADGKPYEEDVLYAEIEPEASRDKKVVIVPGENELDLWVDRRPEFYDVISQPQPITSKIR
ncbi:carbon-nitrogen hydrolase family protein [Chloroflexota bacterium]